MYSSIKRRRVVAVGVLVLALSLATLLLNISRVSATATGSAQTFISNGDFGQIYWFDPTTSTYGDLTVTRNGSQSKPQTYLYYYVYQYNPCCSYKYGSGLIPNTDLSGSGTLHMSLNTNTCSVPDFATAIGPCGVIVVNWQKNGFSSSSQSGTSITNYGPVRYLYNGSYSSTSAMASGNVIGSPITNGDGGIGTNHNASIQVRKGPQSYP